MQYLKLLKKPLQLRIAKMEITEYKLNSILIFPSNGKSAASISACIFRLHASEAPTRAKKDEVKKEERVQNYVCAKVIC